MWLSSKTLRPLAFAASLCLGAGLLAACSFTPLYGENSAVGTSLDLAYAEPETRLDQIIYQDLALRLGRTRTADAPLVTVKTSRSGRRVGRTSSGSPATTYESIVTASVTVTRQLPTSSILTENEQVSENKEEISDKKSNVLYSVSRKASATFTTNGQRLADQQAIIDADERAALAVAQTLRLLLAANLPGKL